MLRIDNNHISLKFFGENLWHDSKVIIQRQNKFYDERRK
ncbi:hypothetical protein BH11BAC5_BH11BAC5_53550 [soil metagenome]